jgi:hypothetical protein
MPMSVIILDGKTMVEVNNVLLELEEAVDVVVYHARVHGLSTSAVLQAEQGGSITGGERNGKS